MRLANPEETDRALEASLTLSLGSRPVPVWEDRITEGGWDGVITGYRLPLNMPQDGLAKAYSEISRAMAPMVAGECVGLLGELKLTTVPRGETTENLEAQLMLYARKLEDYPADVVRRVLRSQANLSKWWPAWAELKERLDTYSHRRLRLRESLLRDGGMTSIAGRTKIEF